MPATTIGLPVASLAGVLAARFITSSRALSRSAPASASAAAWLEYHWSQAARYFAERKSREFTMAYRALALENWRLSEESSAASCAPVSGFRPLTVWLLVLLTSKDAVNSRLLSAEGSQSVD